MHLMHNSNALGYFAQPTRHSYPQRKKVAAVRQPPSISLLDLRRASCLAFFCLTIGFAHFSRAFAQLRHVKAIPTFPPP
jgi:hypothetical protein